MEMLVTITGRSCSGKDYLIKLLMDKYPELFDVLTSITTRSPRNEQEITNRAYYFINQSDFWEMELADEVLEWRKVKDNYYGITKEEMIRKRASGKALLMILEPGGVHKMAEYARQENITHYSIWLDAPTDMLLSRLKRRGYDEKRAQQIIHEEPVWEEEFPYHMNFVATDDRDAEFIAKFTMQHVTKKMNKLRAA